jgi:hypothetical protein
VYLKHDFALLGACLLPVPWILKTGDAFWTLGGYGRNSKLHYERKANWP